MKNNELTAARRAFTEAKDALPSEMLSSLLIPAREAGRKVSPATLELYYSDVSFNRAESLLKKLDAMPEEERTPRIRAAVDNVIAAARAVSAAICKDTDARVADHVAGYRYSFPTAPEGPATSAWRASLDVGDRFLVQYGHGTQLVRVTKRAGTTLGVDRLVNRGTRFAHWRPSNIRRDDVRILGPSRPVAEDPA